MNAIILAAGRGIRMQPWTETWPKVLFRVGGKPLLTYHVERLNAVGVADIVVTAWHLWERIGEWWDGIRKDYPGIRIFVEPELLPTGTACRTVMEDSKWRRAVIVNGDTWQPPEVYDELQYLYGDSRRHFIFTEPPGSKRNGLVEYNETTRRITRIGEHGGLTRANGRNSGIVILSSDVVAGRGGDLMTDMLSAQRSLFAHLVPGGIDAGTPEGYAGLWYQEYYGRPAPREFIETATRLIRIPGGPLFAAMFDGLTGEDIARCIDHS
ncbi:MAG TPA: NDP-sugar synthase [Dehalococcoidia bacterium]|nr:NDP-sugar synthase [Dehalococcoidia bacterium]